MPKALANLKPNQVGYSGEDQIKIVEFLLENLKDSDGNPIKLDDHSMDRIQLVYRTTEPVQRRVLLQTLADAGYTLDASAINALVPLISMAEFSKWLSKTENPKTKKPYITLEKKRGVKVKMFDALLSSPTPGPAGAEGSASKWKLRLR